MKRVFIVNPTSGNGKSTETANKIKQLLDNDGEKYDMIFTTKPKEATEIAKRYSNTKEKCIIYSVGGDGTLFEVLNGMAESNNLLGIIPAGTGNDFVKSINNSKKDVTKVDLCRMNEYYFINIASIGIDADIANNKNKETMKKIPKSLRYIVSIIKTFFMFHAPHVKTIINNTEYDQKITILAVCNGKYYGGGFKIAPSSIYNDGKFDIYLANRINKLKMPRLILKVFKGTHEKSKNIKCIRSNKIEIHTDKEVNCNLDGEIYKLKDMTFRIMNRKVSIYTANDKIKKLWQKK